MAYKIDLGYCILYSKDFVSKNILNLIKRSFRFNQRFFNTKIPKFKIIFVYSRKQFDKLWGYKTGNYAAGFSKNNKIVIFPPDYIEKATCWKKKDFYSTLVHEISHLFYTKMAGTYNPIWLSEGIATFLQHKKKNSKKIKITYSILIPNFKSKLPLDYNIYHYFVYFLIKKYGKKRLFNFIRNVKKYKDTDKAFLIAYNKPLKEICKICK